MLHENAWISLRKYLPKGESAKVLADHTVCDLLADLFSVTVVHIIPAKSTNVLRTSSQPVAFRPWRNSQ
jgi:hypothetical protein